MIVVFNFNSTFEIVWFLFCFVFHKHDTDVPLIYHSISLHEICHLNVGKDFLTAKKIFSGETFSCR